MYTLSNLKELRQLTGVSYDLCKKALEESKNDISKAKILLRKWGHQVAQKKSQKKTGQGTIFSYVHHNGKIASLVCVLCETDFVAKNSDFKNLGQNIAMQIASNNPKNLDELLESSYIKDESITIKQLINDYVLKIGENIKIGKFICFTL